MVQLCLFMNYSLKLNKGMLTFEIDRFGYQIIPKGAKSLLTYKGYELVSFEGWYPAQE